VHEVWAAEDASAAEGRAAAEPQAAKPRKWQMHPKQSVGATIFLPWFHVYSTLNQTNPASKRKQGILGVAEKIVGDEDEEKADFGENRWNAFANRVEIGV
jgi:hypothetical protein